MKLGKYQKIFITRVGGSVVYENVVLLNVKNIFISRERAKCSPFLNSCFWIINHSCMVLVSQNLLAPFLKICMLWDVARMLMAWNFSNTCHEVLSIFFIQWIITILRYLEFQNFSFYPSFRQFDSYCTNYCTKRLYMVVKKNIKFNSIVYYY